MQTLQWNARTITLVAVAAVLTLSVGVMGYGCCSAVSRGWAFWKTVTTWL